MGASKRALKLDDWGISWEEYKELSYFCLQYNQKKRDAAALLTIRSSTPAPDVYYTERKIVLSNGQEKTVKVKHGTFQPHGSGQTSDPVAVTAAKRDRLLHDVRLIEQAARAADLSLAPYILRAVTTRDGVRKVMAAMHVPCGKNEFYDVRRRFFWILREMKNGDIESVE